MFFKRTTVDGITKQMSKMTKQLDALALKREKLATEAFIASQNAKARAERELLEASRARTVAGKIAELVA